MTTDSSQEPADKIKTDSAQPEAAAPGVLIARRWLHCASRIAGRAVPGQSTRHFVDALLDRHRPDGRIRAFARQVEGRLDNSRLDSRIEVPSLFFDHWPNHWPMPGSRSASQPGNDAIDQRVSQAAGGLSRAFAKPARRVGGTNESSEPAKAMASAAPLPDAVTQSLPLRLEEPVRTLMAGMLDMRIPAVKIYTNQAADQVTRRFRADAVAYEDSILFRSGRFEPATARGLGLLGHELTHTVQARMRSTDPSTPNASEIATQAESLALANEQRILNRLSGYPVPVPTDRISGGFPAPQGPAVKPRAVHAAATDRAVTAGDAAMANPTAQLSSTQLRQIKDAVYRDLMEQLRTEFERGG
jgi:hypothetical protein